MIVAVVTGVVLAALLILLVCKKRQADRAKVDLRPAVMNVMYNADDKGTTQVTEPAAASEGVATVAVQRASPGRGASVNVPQAASGGKGLFCALVWPTCLIKSSLWLHFRDESGWRSSLRSNSRARTELRNAE